MSEELKTAAISWAQRQPTFPKREDWVIKNYSDDPPPCGRDKLHTLFGSYNNFRREAGVDILQHDSAEEITLDSLKRDCTSNDEGCWLWQKSTSEQGYANKKIKNKLWKVHRYVHIILGNNPPPSSKHTIDHICRNKSCIAPDHLRWATPSEQRLNQIRPIYSKKLIYPPKASCLEERLNWYLQQSSTDENGCVTLPIRPKDNEYIRFKYGSKHYYLHILSALQKYKYPITRISYESFTKDNIVLHKCNNRRCGNSDHLTIGTGYHGLRQNSIDSRSYHSGYRLKDTDIPEIREIYSDCLEMQWAKMNIYRHIGSIYAVSPITICSIINGKRWTDIK